MSKAFYPLQEHVEMIQSRLTAEAASIYVIQNGRTMYEWYSGRHGGDAAAGNGDDAARLIDEQSRFHIASVRKTYLGLAIGLALYEGRIGSLDDSVERYLDQSNGSAIYGTTIRHLLTHTHGMESLYSRSFPPGSDWTYNNVGVNLLIRIIEVVFREPLAKVLSSRVFEPCGFKETGWCKDRGDKLVWTGEHYVSDTGAEANLFVSTRELALWGQLHLEKGQLNGVEVIPSCVFEQVLSVVTPEELPGGLPRHGFFWWVQDKPRERSELGSELPLNSFQSLGFYGNICLVIPETQTVAVRMLYSSQPDPADYDYIQDVQTFGNIAYRCSLDTALNG